MPSRTKFALLKYYRCKAQIHDYYLYKVGVTKWKGCYDRHLFDRVTADLLNTKVSAAMVTKFAAFWAKFYSRRKADFRKDLHLTINHYSKYYIFCMGTFLIGPFCVKKSSFVMTLNLAFWPVLPSLICVVDPSFAAQGRFVEVHIFCYKIYIKIQHTYLESPLFLEVQVLVCGARARDKCKFSFHSIYITKIVGQWVWKNYTPAGTSMPTSRRSFEPKAPCAVFFHNRIWE